MRYIKEETINRGDWWFQRYEKKKEGTGEQPYR